MAGRELPGLGLKGDWSLGEDNWKDENDLNLLKLSVLTQGSFAEKLAAEPGAPAEGDIVLLDETHATHPNEIAVYDEAAWNYILPRDGMLLYNEAEGYYEKFDGTVGLWAKLETGGGGGAVGGLAGITVIQRTTAQSIATGSWQSVSWQAELYDNLDAFNIASPTVWTVPVGVAWMRVNFKTAWANGAGSGRYILVEKASGAGEQYIAGSIVYPVNEAFQNIVSPWTPVTPGDTYKVSVNSGSSTVNLGSGFGGYPRLSIDWANSLDDLILSNGGA